MINILVAVSPSASTVRGMATATNNTEPNGTRVIHLAEPLADGTEYLIIKVSESGK